MYTVTDYSTIAVPKEKWWTYTTSKGIDLNFGLENGDTDKYESIVLGGENPHLMMIGSAGSGKTSTLNQLFVTLLSKYSPDELSIYSIDPYEREEILTREIPQVKEVCKEYSIDAINEILVKVIGILNERISLFREHKIMTFEQFREANPNHILPRVLVVIPEFKEVIKNKEIRDGITILLKLGRSCGCHLFCIDPNLNQCMDDQMLSMFSLRVSLHYTEEIVERFIGSGAIFDEDMRYGYLYTTTRGGEDSSYIRLWKVPFINFVKVKEFMIDMCEEKLKKV